MQSKEIRQIVTSLVRNKEFAEAEKVLLEASAVAENRGDDSLKCCVLSELIELYSIMDPPQVTKAKALSLKREALESSAYSRLQTAMIMQFGAQDYESAAPKLEQAIIAGKQENDVKTTYTSLSLLGQASLKLGNIERALQVLTEIESMVANKRNVVVGDETGFLEGLRSQGLERERVANLASTLARVCRDPAFKKRLTDLTQ